MVELFGGAARCSIPQGWTDAALLRDVPSHQEVFVNESGSESVIIEILQRESTVADWAAGEFFFKDLAEADSAVSWELSGDGVAVPTVFLGKDATRVDVAGTQVKGKSGPSAVPRPVWVCMTVFRSAAFDSDVLVSSHFEGLATEEAITEASRTHGVISNSLKFLDPNLFI